MSHFEAVWDFLGLQASWREWQARTDLLTAASDARFTTVTCGRLLAAW